jgi:hypothetical protein
MSKQNFSGKQTRCKILEPVPRWLLKNVGREHLIPPDQSFNTAN